MGRHRAPVHSFGFAILPLKRGRGPIRRRADYATDSEGYSGHPRAWLPGLASIADDLVTPVRTESGGTPGHSRQRLPLKLQPISGSSRESAASTARSAQCGPWTGDLTAQDRDLMLEHQDLRILDGIAAPRSTSEPNTPTMNRYVRRMSTSAERRAAGQAHTPDSGTASTGPAGCRLLPKVVTQAVAVRPSCSMTTRTADMALASIHRAIRALTGLGGIVTVRLRKADSISSVTGCPVAAPPGRGHGD